jgi:hypothetical protein
MVSARRKARLGAKYFFIGRALPPVAFRRRFPLRVNRRNFH